MRTPACIVPLYWLLVVMLGGVVQIKAGERPELQIINGSSQPIEIFWLKADAERVPNGTAAPGEAKLIQTTIGHRFRIVGRDDGAEAVVTATLPVQAFRFQPSSRGNTVEDAEGQVIPPPGRAAVPPFYAKFISARGYPIVASARVNDYALKEAAFLVNAMLDKRPDVRAAMIQSGSRLCIMAHDEFTTDLPEFQNLGDTKQLDGLDGKSFWDARARGLGGSRTDPYCSCGEENLLGYAGDPYATENILIHEFAHNIHLRGMVNVDPTFDTRLKETYAKAMAQGLWKGKYASVDPHEYFAEGVQSWFDDNRENDHDHNHVNTRAELLEYDPGLAALCREVFGDTVLVYTKPRTRLSGHLAGYDPSKAPTFVWPPRLDKARSAIQSDAQTRDRKANQ
ncbi:MAG: hypothetical protein P4L85_22640 [Paludisphaera borealis]|uniref:hypothetical protein n=1 Tax=Paludisphaera borealis TaxID=1387353 RepID=UPI002848109C|nr:hypothetical protein [Paludisphaera borealis]MDR3622166.1 hypothetical protein [Paludisphaera borealis]